MSIGTTRNLTSQFVKLRNDARRARGPVVHEDRATAKLLGAAIDGSSDIELGSEGIAAAFVPSWVQKSEKIKAEMSVLKDRMNKLKEYHSKALLVSFEADTGPQSHADALTQEVQLGFKRLDAEIRAMGQAPGSGDDDKQVRLQVQRQLAQALFRLSVEFRKEETRFLNKMEAQKGLEQGSSIGIVEEEGGRGDAVDAAFTEMQLMKVGQSETLVEERDEEIRKVVETITELAQIMRDLSTLVVEQGTMLDRIDHNIEEVAVKVEDGVKQLVRAEQTQKQGRAVLCIMALLVLIVVMLIVVIIRHTSGLLG